MKDSFLYKYRLFSDDGTGISDLSTDDLKKLKADLSPFLD
jgi:hypothetical protein